MHWSDAGHYHTQRVHASAPEGIYMNKDLCSPGMTHR
jgi:hypothetical protein